MADPVFDPNRAVAIEAPTFDPARAIAVKEPEKTVLYEDRGQVVSFPDSYDQKEMDYSVATDIDKKDKTDFFGMLEYGGKLAANFGKGLVNFFASSPQIVGSLVKEYGEGLDQQNKDDLLLPPGIMRDLRAQRSANADQVPRRLAEAGQKLIDMNKKFLEEHSLQPTEPGAPKTAFDLGSAVGSIGSSIGLTFLTKKPQFVAPLFGAIQKTQIYEEARAKDIDPLAASKVSSVAGLAEGALEFVGLHVFLESIKVSKPIARIALRSLSEGVQEGSQQAAEETITGLSGIRKDTREDIIKRIAYATALGFVAGVPVAGVMHFAEHQGVQEDLQKEGLDASQAEATIKAVSAAQVKGGLIDEVASVIEKETSPMVMDSQERTKAYADVAAQVSAILKPAEVQAEPPLGDLGVDFVAKTDSKRPTFDQQIKQVVGKSITRENVMASIQDEKVKLKLKELDEQTGALNQTATYLEKRQAQLDKTGQNSVTVSKMLEETQRQFDVAHSEIAEILTSAKESINFNQQKLVTTGDQMTDSALKQRVQGFKEGAKAGRHITQEEFLSTRGQLFELVKQSELTPQEAGSLLTRAEVEAIKTPRQLENKLGDLEAKIGTIVDTRHARELKGKIQDLLNGTRTKTEGGKPIGKYTPEIQHILDRAREIGGMTQAEARGKIDANLAAMGDELPSDEVRLENALLETMAGFNKKDPSQLAVILNELDALTSAGKAESFLKSLNRRERQATELAEGLNTLTGGKALDQISRETFWKKTQKKWRSLGSSVWSNWDDILNQLSLADTSTKSGQSTLSKRFSVSKIAIEERASVANLAQKMVEEGQKIYGFKSEFQFAKKMHADLAEENSDVFTFSDGQTKRLSMSRAQMRKRWMELQDPNLVESIMSPEGNAYTDEIVKWIENHLTLDDIHFAQSQLAFYKDYYASINDVYREQYGIDLPFNEFYSPIRRSVDTDILANPLKQEAEEYASFIPGSLKSRVKNLHPIKDVNDWEVIQRHIIQMEHFRFWADKIRDLNSFFSNGSVKTAIEQQFGGDMNNVIANFLKDFKTRGVRRAQSWEKWFNMYRTGKIVSELGLKPVQVLKQVTGMFAYAEFVSPTEFVSGMKDFATDPKKVFATLGQSKELKSRWGNITQEFVGLMSSEDARAFQNNPNFKNAVHLSMSAIRVGDQAGIILGGWSVYKAALAKTGSPEAAMDAFEKAILTVQPTSYVGGLTEWQRGNAFQKAFTMFTSSQHRYFMRELTAIRDALAGRASPADVAKVVAIHHLLIPGLFQLIADGFKWDDEEQLRAALTGPLNGAFILGDILDGFVRVILNQIDGVDLDEFRKDAPFMEPFNGIEQAIRKLEVDDISFESVIASVQALATKTIGPVTGLPTKLILDVWPKGVSDIVENDEPGRGTMKLLGWSPYQIDKVYDKE